MDFRAEYGIAEFAEKYRRTLCDSTHLVSPSLLFFLSFSPIVCLSPSFSLSSSLSLSFSLDFSLSLSSSLSLSLSLPHAHTHTDTSMRHAAMLLKSWSSAALRTSQFSNVKTHEKCTIVTEDVLAAINAPVTSSEALTGSNAEPLSS